MSSSTTIHVTRFSFSVTLSLTCAHTRKHTEIDTHTQDTERVVVPFHSCEHLVQLCNGEFGLMKHMGDGALTQRMVDSVCACVCVFWGCVSCSYSHWSNIG